MARLLSIICVVTLLGGCSKVDRNMAKILNYREQLIAANQCSFQAKIVADYGNRIYDFDLDCIADKNGNLQFVVLAPDSISDITGQIHAGGGRLSFDSTVLAFPLIADGLLSPVSAPWIFLNALRSGYIISTGATDDGFRLTVNDSYAEDALRVDIWMDKQGAPFFGEIFWKNTRILSLTIENFCFM